MRSHYFDEEGRQLKPLPKKWMDASRFKVGDKIEWLDNTTVHFGCDECKAKSYFHYNNANRERCEDRPMCGLIGVVTEVRNGRGTYPGRWMADFVIRSVLAACMCNFLSVRTAIQTARSAALRATSTEKVAIGGRLAKHVRKIVDSFRSRQ